MRGEVPPGKEYRDHRPVVAESVPAVVRILRELLPYDLRLRVPVFHRVIGRVAEEQEVLHVQLLRRLDDVQEHRPVQVALLVPLRRIGEVDSDDVDARLLYLAHHVEREGIVPVVVPRIPCAVGEELRPLVGAVAADHDVRDRHGRGRRWCGVRQGDGLPMADNTHRAEEPGRLERRILAGRGDRPRLALRFGKPRIIGEPVVPCRCHFDLQLVRAVLEKRTVDLATIRLAPERAHFLSVHINSRRRFHPSEIERHALPRLCVKRSRVSGRAGETLALIAYRELVPRDEFVELHRRRRSPSRREGESPRT